jgi:hypothetical protein
MGKLIRLFMVGDNSYGLKTMEISNVIIKTALRSSEWVTPKKIGSELGWIQEIT